MRFLADTQALLWWLMDSDELGSRSRRYFLCDEPVISPVVLWEIAIKTGLGKLDASIVEICAEISQQGFERLGLTDQDMIALTDLPDHHRDPFDRMLIVQALRENIPLLSSDGKISLYKCETLDPRL